MLNYYEILQINPDSDIETVRAAYHTMMFNCRCHPDLGGSMRLAQEINEAYEVLSNVEKRRRYDEMLLGSSQGGRVPLDRRRIVRITVNILANYRRADSGKCVECRIADISALGCRLQSKEAIEKFTQVYITIQGHSIEGVVRWKRLFHPTLFSRLYEAGVEFMREFEALDLIKTKICETRSNTDLRC